MKVFITNKQATELLEEEFGYSKESTLAMDYDELNSLLSSVKTTSTFILVDINHKDIESTMYNMVDCLTNDIFYALEGELADDEVKLLSDISSIVSKINNNQKEQLIANYLNKKERIKEFS